MKQNANMSGKYSLFQYEQSWVHCPIPYFAILHTLGRVGSTWPDNLWIASCGGDIYAISTWLFKEPLLKSAQSIAVEALVKERTDLTGHLLCLPEEHVHDLKCRWFGTVNWKGHAALLWRSDNTILDEMGPSQFQKLFFICQVVSWFDALKGTHRFGRKLTIGHVGPSCAVKMALLYRKGIATELPEGP